MYVLKQNVLNYATTDCYAYQFLGVAHVPSLRWPMPHLQSQQWYINSFSYHFIPNSSSATFRKSCDYTGPMWITPSFPGGSVGRIHLQMQEIGLIPGSGRSPAEGNGNPPQSSCLENPMDSGAWRATAHGVAKVRYDLATNQQQSHHVWACLCFLAQDFLVPSCTFLAVAPKSVTSQRKISLFVGSYTKVFGEYRIWG